MQTQSGLVIFRQKRLSETRDDGGPLLFQSYNGLTKQLAKFLSYFPR